MAKRKKLEDKTKIIRTFNILIPIKLSLSGTNEDERKLNKIYQQRKIKNKSDYLRVLLARRIKYKSGIRNFEELANQTSAFSKFKEDLIEDMIEYGSDNTKDNISAIIRTAINKEVGDEKS